MDSVDKRFALIADNGEKLYPYKKTQKKTGRYGFALTAPGEQDRHGGGTYTEDFELVVIKLIHEGWSVRAKTVSRSGTQREGTLGIGKRVIVGYELSDEFEHLINDAAVKPSKILTSGKKTIKVEPVVPQVTVGENAIDEKTLREIKTRRGQPAFRKSLLAAFEQKCCVTGCDVVNVLEAAHIIPHAVETSYLVTNGLLLRADIHTLFDLNLIGIDEEGQVHLSEELDRSEYAKFKGTKISSSLPEQTKNNLKARYEKNFINASS